MSPRLNHDGTQVDRLFYVDPTYDRQAGNGNHKPSAEIGGLVLNGTADIHPSAETIADITIEQSRLFPIFQYITGAEVLLRVRDELEYPDPIAQ